MDIRNKLFELKDETYGDFSAKLAPTIPRKLFIGVRAPMVKALAKEVHKKKELEEEFLDDLPHKYIEEYLLHIYLINREKDLAKCMKKIDDVLLYVDNWMTCDAIRPVIFKRHLKEVESYIKQCVGSKEVYTSRFGIEMLMCYYLNEEFSPTHLEWVSASRIDNYYHKMMVAWYFATALAKQYEYSLPYIENRKLEKWTHNKTIQKAKESFRVSSEKKDELIGLKWL